MYKQWVVVLQVVMCQTISWQGAVTSQSLCWLSDKLMVMRALQEDTVDFATFGQSHQSSHLTLVKQANKRIPQNV